MKKEKTANKQPVNKDIVSSASDFIISTLKGIVCWNHRIPPFQYLSGFMASTFCLAVPIGALVELASWEDLKAYQMYVIMIFVILWSCLLYLGWVNASINRSRDMGHPIFIPIAMHALFLTLAFVLKVDPEENILASIPVIYLLVILSLWPSSKKLDNNVKFDK